MIDLKRGDILKADVEALVNTVNCVGIMGRGIALQFRKAFPDNYKVYRAACEKKQVQPGKMLIHDLGKFLYPRYIINFPTKRHWRGKSRLEDIESGLAALVKEVRKLKIKSIAIPPLGAGLGGLRWEDVRRRIEDAFRDMPEIEVLLFEPAGAPAPEKMAKEQKAPRMTPGRAALLGLMKRYLSAVMDPTITLLEIHKLMYFMQEAGEPLRLRYNKGTYGPYAENLRHVLSQIDGYFISGYGDTEDKPEKAIELNPEAVGQADSYLANHHETLQRFKRVYELIAGFETPFGMELLATVHWVASREAATSQQEALLKSRAWHPRKSMFSEQHVAVAWEVLNTKKWLKTAATHS